MGAGHTWSDQVLPLPPTGDTGIVDLALQISNQGILKMSGPYIVRNNEGTTSLSFKSTTGWGWESELGAHPVLGRSYSVSLPILPNL